MKAIYETKGAAREYCPLACNLYRGCTNGCRYCYVPAVLRMSRKEFHSSVTLRPGIAEAFAKEAPKYRGRSVLFCFTCDPFPKGWEYHEFWWSAKRTIDQACRENDIEIVLLTKNELSRPFADRVRYGITATSIHAEDAAYWEPGATPPLERKAPLKVHHGVGAKTWMSLEPVIDPVKSLEVIEAWHDFVDEFKVGKANHIESWNCDESEKERIRRIDWRDFGTKAIALLEKLGKKYYIKQALKEAMVNG